jgi:2-polyprenyl-3-methyl-5-hydroxy-6-metoxy-1,4-benzoquinol methylase
MLDMYNKYVTANHLDIGVGTGYFLDKCDFPSPNPRLALMDLNANSLRFASRRLARYHPEVYQRNALEPFNMDTAPFDSIGMMNLLHCLPGNMNTKGIVFENAKSLLSPGGVVFGSTILYEGVKRNGLATVILKINNRKGFMTNMEDSIEVLKQKLEYYFAKNSVKVVGCEALFCAET